MDNMIERVCCAMLIESRPGVNPYDLTPMPRGRSGLMPKWRMYEHLARAAIEAMRQPNEAMRQAGADNLFGAASDDWKDDAGAIWSAMIEVALSPSPAPAGERL
jgi:hypothetical protein